MKSTNKSNVDILEAGLKKVADSTLDGAEKIIDKTGEHFERAVSPIRQSIFKRFPTVFLLVVTFGAAATFTGMEQLLIQYDLLREHPEIILALGIGALALTGRLYKKLG